MDVEHETDERSQWNITLSVYKTYIKYYISLEGSFRLQLSVWNKLQNEFREMEENFQYFLKMMKYSNNDGIFLYPKKPDDDDIKYSTTTNYRNIIFFLPFLYVMRKIINNVLLQHKILFSSNNINIMIFYIISLSLPDCFVLAVWCLWNFSLSIFFLSTLKLHYFPWKRV